MSDKTLLPLTDAVIRLREMRHIALEKADDAEGVDRWEHGRDAAAIESVLSAVQAPVPPHAAGEQAAIAIRGDHLVDIATQSTTLTVSADDGTVQRSCNLAGCDGRCDICSPTASQLAGAADLIREAREYIEADNHSPDGYAEDLVSRLIAGIPAASQAAPEPDYPKWVADVVREARIAGGSVTNWCGVVAYLDRSRQRLADRVAELERRETVHKIRHDDLCRGAMQYRRQISTLQASTAQETKRARILDTYRHTVEGLLGHDKYCNRSKAALRPCDCTRAGLLSELYDHAR